MSSPTSWLKTVGHYMGVAAKEIVGVLSSQKAQDIEKQAANVAALLLPAEAPLIQTFQTIMGKIFQQAVVTETAMTNIASSGSSKLQTVVTSFETELDQWVANNFPGSAKISAATKNGLVNAIVALQNDITVPPSQPGSTAPAS